MLNNSISRYAPRKILAATIGLIIAISVASGSEAGTKVVTFDVKEMTNEVKLISKNRKFLSCIELTLGSLKAAGLKTIATSKNVVASAATKKLASSTAASAGNAIEKEMECHCDRGAAMEGYLLYERRAHLQKNARNKKLNKSLLSFYPKDAAGKPRFLKTGEPLKKSVLMSLPAAPVQERFDDCRRSCKRSRKRTNEAAVAQGKPEPFPNLEYPRKKSCKR